MQNEKTCTPKTLQLPQEKCSLFLEWQYGFPNKLSTKQAFIDITSTIQTACDKGIFALILYCFEAYVLTSKAFDTVNHEFLLNKLNHYDIRGAELHWLRRYLRGRQQYTITQQ